MRTTLLYAVMLAITCAGVSWADPAQKSLAAEKTAASPAVETSPLPTPLPAERFQGRVREAYKIAAEIPEVLAGVTCYCGCNKSLGHRNLLACFVDDHGAG